MDEAGARLEGGLVEDEEDEEGWKRRPKIGGNQKKKWRKTVKRKRNVVWIPVELERETPTSELEEDDFFEHEAAEEEEESGYISPFLGPAPPSQAMKQDKAKRATSLPKSQEVKDTRRPAKRIDEAVSLPKRREVKDTRRHAKRTDARGEGEEGMGFHSTARETESLCSPTVPQHSATTRSVQEIQQQPPASMVCKGEEHPTQGISLTAEAHHEDVVLHIEIEKLKAVFKAGFVPEEEFHLRLAALITL